MKNRVQEKMIHVHPKLPKNFVMSDRTGLNFDDFLKDDGIYEGVTAKTRVRVA